MATASMGLDPTAFDALPSPPLVLLELLDAFVDEAVEFETLARICARDPSLTTRMLAIANSAAFRRRAPTFTSLERVLVTLGLDTIKTVALTTALVQAFAPERPLPAATLAAFWRHALVTAALARALARTLSIDAPERLYLAGLLHDIGRLVIATQRGEWPPEGPGEGDAAHLLVCERERLGVDHCAVGGALLAAWRLPEPLVMAARHHHAPLAALADAPPTLRLVHLANALDSPHWREPEALALADALFGLTPALAQRLHREAVQQVEPLCAALGFESGAAPGAPLTRALRDRALVDGLDGQLVRAEDEDALLATIARCVVVLFGIDRARFLVAEDGRLRGRDPLAVAPGFAAIDCAADGEHLPARAFAGEPCSTLLADDGPGVLEHQLAAGAEALYCLPLRAAGEPGAVLVLAPSAAQLARLRARERLLRTFGEVCGRALVRLREQRLLHQRAAQERALLERARLRQVVHEAGNPLSIAQNYLELLAQRLADDAEANADLLVLREELERVGTILVRLVDGDEAAGDGDDGDPAESLRRLVGVLDHALCRPRGIAFSCTCPDSLPPLRLARDALRQVVVNLVRNAAEALGEGGRIEVAVEDGVRVGGRAHVELRVEDDGPGLAAERLETLFQPQQSAKPGHAGVGLTIVRNLVEAAGGLVSCRSRPNAGCRFQVLLPLRRP
ncbi:HDOD domain-containing protein [Marichromatium gracile]|nr:HDOD domain-containing protein [Marichromatium gracile]